MKISIIRHTRTSKSHFGDDQLQTFENFDLTEFSKLKDELSEIASLNKVDLKTESKNELHSESNSSDFGGRLFYGGGVDTVTIIETVSLHIGTLTVILKSLKYFVPIVEKYIEKRSGRSITIESGENRIVIENKKDLDLAMEAFKELQKMEKMEKGKKKKK